MKILRLLLFTALMGVCFTVNAQNLVHVWEKQELTFTAANTYKNAYTDVLIWIDLAGPGFNKRIYGFWDGGSVFHLRLVATQPGKWTWKSGSSPEDTGLSGKSGSFTAVSYTHLRA